MRPSGGVADMGVFGIQVTPLGSSVGFVGQIHDTNMLTIIVLCKAQVSVHTNEYPAAHQTFRVFYNLSLIVYLFQVRPTLKPCRSNVKLHRYKVFTSLCVKYIRSIKVGLPSGTFTARVVGNVRVLSYSMCSWCTLPGKNTE